MTPDALSQQGTTPVCTHETSLQDLNLPCQACLLAERDRYRAALQQIASMGSPLDTMAPVSSFGAAQRLAKEALHTHA